MSKIQVDSIVNKDDTGAPDFPNGATVSGIVTATSFTGNLTGNATGLSGSPTLSGITSVSTTNLTVNGNAYPNGGPLSNRNIVINGAMQVAQRGTSSTSTGYRTVDRFRTQVAGGTVTQSHETLSSGDPFNEGFRHFFRLTNTTDSSLTSVQREIRYYAEAQDIAGSGWQYTSSASYVTLSYWVRSSLGGTYYNYLRSLDGTSTPSYTTSFTLTADTWLKVTKTIPGGTNLAFNNDTGLGLDIRWMVDLGTDYSGSGATLDTWRNQDDAQRTPDFSQDWAGTTNATFDITGVQLEVGSVATPFEHRSFGDELRRCQRYYYKVTADVGNVTPFGPCAGQSATRAIAYIAFPTTMRSAPTSLEQTGTASDYYIRTTTDTACSSVPLLHDRATTNGCMLNVYISSGLSAGYAANFGANIISSYLAFPAEL